MVQSGLGSDRRQGKAVFWREARLCCARSAQEVEPVYGVTLGTVEVAGWLWRQTAHLAGCERKTHVHGVGDGAGWIVDKFQENFGEQGTYLVDFYHVSEYLSGAASKVARPGKEKEWRHRQQGRLLNNRVAAVLRSLEKHVEPEQAAETPVRAAHRYLQERLEQLD
jgi:hypothetical protein